MEEESRCLGLLSLLGFFGITSFHLCSVFTTSIITSFLDLQPWSLYWLPDVSIEACLSTFSLKNNADKIKPTKTVNSCTPQAAAIISPLSLSQPNFFEHLSMFYLSLFVFNSLCPLKSGLYTVHFGIAVLYKITKCPLVPKSYRSLPDITLLDL